MGSTQKQFIIRLLPGYRYMKLIAFVRDRSPTQNLVPTPGLTRVDKATSRQEDLNCLKKVFLKLESLMMSCLTFI